MRKGQGVLAAKLYYRQVKKNLTCPRKIKKKLLSRLKFDLNSYVEEQPDIKLDEIIDRFGCPTELGHAYISSLETPQIIKQMKKSQKIGRIALVFCSIAILLLIAAIVKMICNNANILYRIAKI